MGAPPPLAADAVSSMLLPLWQLVIGVLVLVTVVVSVRRLFMRGPSRMGGAMLLTVAALVGLTVVGYLVELL